MRFEEIAQCELGIVLKCTASGLPAVLVERCGFPLCTISVEYLDGSGRITGCSPQKFERAKLREGMLLRECSTGRNAILRRDSEGPKVSLQFLPSGEKEIRVLCEPFGTRWRIAFEIAPAPNGTVARTEPP